MADKSTAPTRTRRPSTPKKAPSKDLLASGAARATGERARRRGTPLISGSGASGDSASSLASAADPASTAATSPSATPTTTTKTSADPTPATADAATATPAPTKRTAKHRPHPAPKDPAPAARVVANAGARSTAKRASTGRVLHSVPDLPGSAGRTPGTRKPRPRRAAPPVTVPSAGPDTAGPSTRPAMAHQAPHQAPSTRPSAGPPENRAPADAPIAQTNERSIAPGVEDLVSAGVAALRTVIAATGVSPEEVEEEVAKTLAFLRRRLTGDYHVDEFGFDEDFTTHAYLPLLRPLYRSWFRVEVRGIENIPATGGGLVVANHSGTVALDSVMTQLAVFDEHPQHRHLRMLGADLVFSTPLVAQLARRSGSTLATNPDAERLLTGGELVGVWPEGFKGVGKPFTERYKLQRFGRGGFVAAAIRSGVPIIPCSIIGAEEIYPMIGNLKTLARLVGAPYAPVTPTWPLLGPLGLIPLPSKWIIEFGVPVETASLGPAAADDPMLVFDLTDQVRETIQQTLYALLMQRRSVFF